MAERNWLHVTVTRDPRVDEYTPTGSVRGPKSPPSPSDRVQHGRDLVAQLEAAVDAAAQRKARKGNLRVEGALEGIYVQFESHPGFELALTSLEPQKGQAHPELCAVTTREVNDERVQFATVFVPEGWVGRFAKQFEDYISEDTEAGNPKHRNLVERIAELRVATLRALWTDKDTAFPDPDATVWWELWLRRRDGVENRLTQFAELSGATIGRQRLAFEDRLVVLVRGSSEQLGAALDLLDDIAELRSPVDAAEFLADLPVSDQADFVDELAARLTEPPPDGVVTCLLDSGVTAGHPLLGLAIAPGDVHTVNAAWGADDRLGHGTQMAGLVVHGDLSQNFVNPGPVKLHGRMESVKVLPNAGENPPELYGAITAQAASIAEIAAPNRRRIFTLAVTASAIAAHPSDLGQPSAWSSTVDALAAGRAIAEADGEFIYVDEPGEDAQRLFIVSAGNVRDSFGHDHLDRSDNAPVEEPAQAWNALTVGAYTERTNIGHSDFKGWKPLAAQGDLSPFSRTSVGFRSQWPHKPEVVFEGGNAATSPDGNRIDTPSDLQLLTTRSLALGGRPLTTAAGTSPATAQAAHLVQRLATQYPHLWPEALRALVVHSARWTNAMAPQLPASSRRQVVVAVRRYGWGVPNVSRAMRSADDSVTLIAQQRIRPYRDGTMREMHLHDLPWPTEVLAGLGAQEVHMRVALSYFVEPNPSRRGWNRRFRYASHGLRFEVRRPTETNDEFRKRINKLALAEDEKRPTSDSDADQWLLGPRERVRGSLHIDHWTGPAVELAARGAIAIYPVTGWWKERKDRDRSGDGVRYALIVSIESPAVEVDLWTPVAIEAEVPIVIET